MMMNWTDEAVRAEAAYRRQALHRMVSHRQVTAGRRRGRWSRLLGRANRSDVHGS
jgi:hypothetical protein